mmetsp:Transcript_70476/g.187679  ORF Transcript_70476/g.187679 Transcript_70476/m.187679 type:complete len:302 (+) Transcript_70476:2132-3037(+)
MLVGLVVADPHSAPGAEIPALHQTILTNRGMGLFFHESHAFSTTATFVAAIDLAEFAVSNVLRLVLGHGLLQALLELTRHGSELAELGLVCLKISGEWSVGAPQLPVPASSDHLAVLPALLLMRLQLPVDLGLPAVGAGLLAEVAHAMVLGLITRSHALVAASVGIATASDPEGACVQMLLEVSKRLALGAALVGAIDDTPLAARPVLFRILPLEILFAALESADVLRIPTLLLVLGNGSNSRDLRAPRMLECARQLAERAARLVLQGIPQGKLLLASLISVFTLHGAPVALFLVLLLVLY